jgi:hypothetical protein
VDECRHLVRNVVGQAFFVGIYIDKVHDVGWLENIQLIPLWTGFQRNAQTGVITPPIANWQFNYGTAFLIETTDGEMVTNCFAIRYNRGVDVAISTEAPQAWVFGNIFPNSTSPDISNSTGSNLDSGFNK